MKNKVIKRVLALSLAACLVIPALSYVGSLPEAKAADTEWDAEVGDANGDGSINAIDLVILKKKAGESVAEQYDVNNDGNGDAKDANRMRQFLIGKTSSFYRPDTSAQNNDTATYQVTDDLDREMTDASASNGKAVGVRYFLHHGVEKNNMAELHFYHFNEGKVNVVTKEAYASGSTISFKAKLPEDKTANAWWGIKFYNTSSFDIYGVTGATLIEEIDGWCTYEIEVPSGGPYYFGISGEKNWPNWGDSPIIVDEFKITKPDGTVKEDGFDNGLSGGIFDVTEIGDSANGCTCDVHTAVELISETADSSESAPVYNVSAILAKNSNAAISDSAWLAAGGGPVGAAHWWGEPLFGFYGAMDKWIVERDVQMLTDAGVDYLAIDTDDGILESRLNVLLETLDKFQDQGFNVPKVTFTTAVDSSVIETVNSYGLLYAESMDEVNATTLRLAKAIGGYPMSASAFYGNLVNQLRNYNGKKHETSSETAEYEGAFLEWQFETAIENGAKNVLVESWNEWLSVRQAADSTGAIVLKENASISSSSDMQPMKDGYGDDYYMQFIDCIKRFKGNAIANNNLNTADTTESIAIDVNKDFQQWNKVNTHYLDYTNEEANPNKDTRTTTKQEAEIKFGVDGTYIITKDRYPAGSTISFTIKFPEDLVLKQDGAYPWWSVYAITNTPSGTEFIYNNSIDGLVSPSASDLGKEVPVTHTLPSGSGEYYIYIAGEWGQWKNASGEFVTAEISDITITSGDTTVSDGEIFEAVGSGATLHSVTKVLTNEVIDYAVDINMNDPTSHIITKETYKGGSKVSFDIKLPKDLDLNLNPWWGIYASTSNTVDIYNNWVGSGRYIRAEELGVWQTIPVTLPTDHEEYYIYIAGEELKWKDTNGKNVFTSIDNIVIEELDGTVISEDFNSGYGDVFAVGNSVSLTERAVTEVPMPGTNDIDKMKMTSDGEYLYALVETVDDIVAFGDESNRMSLFISTGNVGGCWNQYEYVINRDSTKASSNAVTIERYAGGAWKQVTDAEGNAITAKYRIEGNMMQLAIPLSALGQGEAFDMEFKWADNYDDEDIYSFYTQGDAAPYGRANYVYQTTGQHADVTINKMGSDNGKMSFITNRTFPGGSTVSFDILVPESGSWWGMCWTTDPTSAGLYDWLEENGSKGKTLSSTIGSWTNCSIELPDDDEDYYVYLVAAVGEWPAPGTGAADTVFSIDNFVVEDGSGNVIAKDTFNGGFSLFDTDASVTLVSDAMGIENQSAKLQFLNFTEGNVAWDKKDMNFISKDSYPAGSVITFKAYLPETSSWWNLYYGSSPDTMTIYPDTTSAIVLEYNTKGTWVEYEKTLPETGYVAIGGSKDNGAWSDAVYMDDFRVYNSNDELIAKDDFREGLHDGLFDIEENNGNNVAVSLGLPTETEAAGAYSNGALAINTAIDRTSNRSASTFPAGSTVTFDAYVPNSLEWWGIDTITDTADIYIYNADQDSNNPEFYGTCAWNQNGYYKDGWSTYTLTLDSTGYFAFEGNTNSATLLIDNIVVTSPEGKVLVKDDFNNETLDECMFDILQSDYVSIVDATDDTVDVEFTAYQAPTINAAVDAAVAEELDEAYKKLAEAGFNKAIAQHELYSTVATGADAVSNGTFLEQTAWRNDNVNNGIATVLDIAEKYNISYYVKDWAFYNLGREKARVTNNGVVDPAVVTSEILSDQGVTSSAIANQVVNKAALYAEHPAYAGHFGHDEPITQHDMQAIATQAAAFKNFNGEYLVNLLPNYDGGGTSDYNSYDAYISAYLDVATANGLDYISWDYYPFMVEDTTNERSSQYMRETYYLQNFYTIATKCRDASADIELRNVIQARSEANNSLRELQGVSDLRFQIYIGMAFGVREFKYYCYSDKTDSNVVGNLYNYETGEYTDIYDWASIVNNEVHAIENIYGDYEWSDIMYKQVTGNKADSMSSHMLTGFTWVDEGWIDWFDKEYNVDGLSNLVTNKNGTYTHSDSKTVTINSCTQDTICGIFDAKDSNATSRPHGYMVTNIADPADNVTDSVQMTFSGAKAVSISMDGKQWIESGNTVKLELQSGAGAFIVPILN